MLKQSCAISTIMMTSDPEKLEMNSAERQRTDHYLKRGCFCTKHLDIAIRGFGAAPGAALS